KGAGTEVAQQELCARIRRKTRQHRRSRVLGNMHAAADELRYFENSGSQDHRGRKQEGESGSLLVAQSREQAATDRDTGPRDAREECERLTRADQRCRLEADPLRL